MNAWLAIVGIGEDGAEGLGRHARDLVANAEVLVGGARHLAMVPDDGRERLTWPRPLEPALDFVLAMRPRRVCVLATGDPMHYGVGVPLARRVPPGEMVIVPAPDAFALACAELGWPRAEVETVTLHGRPLATLAACLRPGARLLALSRNRTTPSEVATFLAERGFGSSRMTVLERMGGSHGRRRERAAHEWARGDGNPDGIADLNTIAVVCVGPPGLPCVPGLADDAYEHDGQITKREVRAATVAALAPGPGALLWDVGAGAGSVAIEWLRTHRRCRAIAIERDPDRRVRIRRNAATLGVPQLAVVAGDAPAALAALESPDAVFIGGSVADEAVWDACWQALRPHGRLVANAVTVAGETRLLARHACHGGSLARMAVSRAETLGGGFAWRALRPVTQLAQTKR